jgi:regulation of enolase protein 1 (concanavalin A-like superfamily)
MAPADPDSLLLAGPYVSAPARAGYTARFHRFSVTPGDASVPGLSRR